MKGGPGKISKESQGTRTEGGYGTTAIWKVNKEHQQQKRKTKKNVSLERKQGTIKVKKGKKERQQFTRKAINNDIKGTQA